MLANAAQYTPERGRIELSVACERDEVVIAIADSGVGIPADMLDRIFEIYQQGERGRGLGIGLAVVRRVLEMHGGTVTAHSAGPGCGSKFVVRLPVAEGVARTVS